MREFLGGVILREQNYHEQQSKDNINKMREVVSTLPTFCRTYFLGIQEYTSPRTRLAYAYDLRVFFDYLHTENAACKKTDITSYTLDLLDQICKEDIEQYLDYVSLYKKDNKEVLNDERGKARKLSALRSLYNYFYLDEKIEKNPAALVRSPKLHEKEIIKLEPNEVAKLLDLVENGENLTKKELSYHAKTKIRDVALLTLLLGTGIRVSECVGLDVSDIDFDVNGIRIIRKGGTEAVIYFGFEVEEALLDYLEQRKKIIASTGHENALFLSMQLKRIHVRSVEKLVKKYASRVTTLKKITPHKLRSTYGTSLYNETGDIYLVADVLGHRDVNTTRKHYAAQADARRREAANKVSLEAVPNKKAFILLMERIDAFVLLFYCSL